ncbi:MAG: recombination mediator RecR [Gammaproteobacteria bacterium]|nr:recombination mediator RecR [Gammaproteobacteria bacterium]
MSTPSLKHLIDSLRCLPGVGQKTAQRMAMHLLERNRQGARTLYIAINDALEKIRHCQRCRNFSETEICDICSSERRDPNSLCLVESPADLVAIEQSTGFRGMYFVLMGRLSPLDGIGPDELELGQLENRLREGGVDEIILALSSTVEGETTAHYISQMAHNFNIRVSRIAYGVPVGGELEHLDSGTLSHAFAGRQLV